MAIDCEPEEEGEGGRRAVFGFVRSDDEPRQGMAHAKPVRPAVDGEQNDCDREDDDPAELSEVSGIGDHEGLLEQIGWNDNQPTVMA